MFFQSHPANHLYANLSLSLGPHTIHKIGRAMWRSLSFFFCLLLAPSVLAQSVLVDWVGKNLVSSPAKINQKTNATIEVQNVNDVLYWYSIQVVATPRVNDDFGKLAGAFGVVAKAKASEGGGSCPKTVVDAATSSTANLGTSITTFYQLPERGGSCSRKAPCSVNIKDTRTEWTSKVAPTVQAATQALTTMQQYDICKKDYGKELTALQDALNNVSDTSSYLFSDHHVVTSETTLEPDVDYTVNIKEMYISSASSAGTQTNADTLSVKFSPATDRLTLSAGALFSQIQNRGYTSQAAPKSDGSGTQNVLVVSGLGALSPSALALLNYEIPKIGKAVFSNDNVGLAVSTGPVLRLGSKSDTSSFGYFVGMSLHLYHRFYISPGVHIGQFADFPPGFSAPGQVIPSGLATPTPVNRYTARFSFGVTYKAKDFSSLGLTTSANASPSPTAKAGAGNQPSSPATTQPPTPSSNPPASAPTTPPSTTP